MVYKLKDQNIMTKTYNLILHDIDSEHKPFKIIFILLESMCVCIMSMRVYISVALLVCIYKMKVNLYFTL